MTTALYSSLPEWEGHRRGIWWQARLAVQYPQVVTRSSQFATLKEFVHYESRNCRQW